MKIIEGIEIRHFRSFDGGMGQPKVDIIGIKDLNIFSGSNDSGKSNVLRALNLFFNNEISPGIPFDIERDLSKTQKDRSMEKANKKRNDGKKDVRQKDLWVKIKVHFKKDPSGVLPERFFVEKTWDKNGLNPKRNHNIKRNDEPKKVTAQEGQLSQFLNNIRFEYVPAVKDRQFFNILFKKLQSHLFEKQVKKEGNKFKDHSSRFNDLLKSETQELFNEFKKSVGIEAGFKIPDTLIDFFRTLGVETENGVSLFDRGDGIQARFIPDILNEISRGSKKKIIWGFEEPENSYEPLRCFQLSQEFMKYSKDKQIFITTHSFPFIALRGENVSAFRIKKENNNSYIGLINWNQRSIGGNAFATDGEKLEMEIGILESYARINEHLGIEIQKPYLYVEGKYDKIYLLKAWKVLFPTTDKPFEVVAKGGRRIINSIEDMSEDIGNRKVIALFDWDRQGEIYFRLSENNLNESFTVLLNKNNVKKHNRKDIYVTLVDPPESRKSWVDANHYKMLEMEHLFEDEFITRLGIAIPKGITVSAKEWEASTKFKQKLGDKIERLEDSECKKNDFQNFRPLFEKIINLFNAE